MRAHEHTDVIVVGGGSAGVCAGVCAARAGLKTMLVEQSALLGGIAVTGMHRYLCGLYGYSSPKGAHDTLNDGIVREVVARLARGNPPGAPLRMGRVWVLPYAAGELRGVFDRLVRRQRNLDVRLATAVVGAEREQETIAVVRVRTQDGVRAIAPRAVIDCSGDAIVAHLCGAASCPGTSADRQLAGFAAHLVGLGPRDALSGLRVGYLLSRASAEQRLPAYLRFTVFRAGAVPGEGQLQINVPLPAEADGLENARRDVCRVHALLARHIRSFAGSTIKAMSSAVAARDGRHVVGDYELSEDDVVRGASFPDGVVRSAWPVEFWDPLQGPRYRYVRAGAYYEIPRRCLASSAVANLFSAGKCISASARAAASTRVVGTCMALGEHAAHAAARYLTGAAAVP